MTRLRLANFWLPVFELWLVTVIDRHSILDEEQRLFSAFTVSEYTGALHLFLRASVWAHLCICLPMELPC